MQSKNRIEQSFRAKAEALNSVFTREFTVDQTNEECTYRLTHNTDNMKNILVKALYNGETKQVEWIGLPAELLKFMNQFSQYNQ